MIFRCVIRDAIIIKSPYDPAQAYYGVLLSATGVNVQNIFNGRSSPETKTA
jgi:hypothetical protein